MSTTQPRPESLGISGGLTNLCALAISTDFESLYDAALEVARVFARLCRFTSVRSRAMEDRPGVWGWAVLGLKPDALGKVLDQFQQSLVRMALHKRLPYKLIYTWKGGSFHQEGQDWRHRRWLEHRHWPTNSLGDNYEPMSYDEEPAKE